jgi:hypothetical protein
VTPRAARPWVAAALVSVACGACGKRSEEQATPPPPVPVAATAPSPSQLPADHLAPDELVEGTEKAFGVALPRGVTIEHRYVDTVELSGTMSVHALVKYFHARLQGGSLREGSDVATFEHVIQPGAVDREILVHIEAGRLGTTRIDLTSFLHEHAPPLPDEEARWRSVGLTKDGKLLDPTHLE